MCTCNHKPLISQVGEEPLDVEAAMERHEGLIHAFIRRQGGGAIPYAEALQAGRIGLWRALLGYVSNDNHKRSRVRAGWSEPRAGGPSRKLGQRSTMLEMLPRSADMSAGSLKQAFGKVVCPNMKRTRSMVRIQSPLLEGTQLGCLFVS